MLLFLATLLLWIPSLAGWALPWARLRERLGGPGLDHLDGGDGVAALTALAALAVLLNFFVPLTSLVSAGALLIGWLLCAVRFSGIRPWAVPVGTGLLALAWIIPAAQLANFPPDIEDSGLYHLQGLLWAHTSAAPLGLANLHGRLAFNNTATPLAALLQSPLWGSTSASSPNILGALLLCIFGAEVFGTLRRPGPRWSRTTSFILLAAVVAWSVVTLSFVPHYYNTNSPASDWPILAMTLLAAAMALRAMDDPTTLPECMAATTLVAFLALTIKFSALPLFGLPAALALYALRQKQQVTWRPLAGLGASIGLGLVLPWISRGVVLSGCLAYPVAVTCLPGLSWSVPLAKVQAEANWVISWARVPHVGWDVTLTGWEWLPTWLKNVSTDATLVISGLLLLVGAGLWAAVRAPQTTRRDLSAALVIGAPLLAGLVYWFFTAPDVRFAAGYLWGLGLLAASLGYHRLAAAPGPGRTARLFRIASLQVCALLIVGSAALMALRSAAYLRAAGPANFLLAWPVVDAAETITRFTEQGEAVQVPVATDRCWLAPLPCTPYFNPALLIERDPAGHIRKFYVAQPP